MGSGEGLHAEADPADAVAGVAVAGGAVYVGRPSKWGNPFHTHGDGVPITSGVGFRIRAFTVYEKAQPSLLNAGDGAHEGR